MELAINQGSVSLAHLFIPWVYLDTDFPHQMNQRDLVDDPLASLTQFKATRKRDFVFDCSDHSYQDCGMLGLQNVVWGCGMPLP